VSGGAAEYRMTRGMVGRTEGAGERGGLALWLGVFAGPVAWALDESVSYSLAPTACATGEKLPLHLASIAAFALALVGLFAAMAAWRRVGGEREGPPPSGRRRFMALSGILLSAGCALSIVALEIPNLVLPLRACR
jgi:hypothetical protein